MPDLNFYIKINNRSLENKVKPFKKKNEHYLLENAAYNL